MCTIDWDILSKLATILISVLALFVSISAMNRNTRFSNKNISLSVQQAIFKIVAEKAHDCNNVWINEPENELKSKDSPHFLVTTELIISIEVINTALILFDKQSDLIGESRSKHFEIFWKQLIPDVRGWVQNVTPIIQKNHNEVFFNQIETIHKNLSPFFD